MKKLKLFAVALIAAVAVASVTHARRPGRITGGGMPIVQSIASVNLSNNTYTSSVANAPVGTVTVTMSPTSPAFSGNVTITGGANTGGFHLVGSCAPPPTCTLEANTGGTTGNGPYTDVIIVATQGVLSPLSINPTLTGTAGPTLTETPSPGSPTIADSTPLSTIIQQFTNTFSPAEPSVGVNTFASPNWDADTYQILGDYLIISPVGSGVSGAGGTTQHTTTVAVQMDMSPDGTIVNAPSATMLANTWGVWNFGPTQSGRTLGGGAFVGGYVLWLNGTQVGSGTIIEVAHGGVLYSYSGAWFTWNGTAFVSSGAP